MTVADEIKREEAAKAAADARKAGSEAEKAAFEAQQQRFAALIPDVSKADLGSLETKGEEPMFGAMLARKALDEAADAVAVDVRDALAQVTDWRLLVTSDADLTSSDGTYWDFTLALSHLDTVTDTLLKASEQAISATTRAGGSGDPKGVGSPADAPPGAPAAAGDIKAVVAAAPAAAVVEGVLGAAAKALPGIISLISTHRVVSVSAATTTDIAASLTVAGAVRRHNKLNSIVHDDFRLLPKGRIAERMSQLINRRGLLAHHKATLEAASTVNHVLVKSIEDALTGIDAFVTFATATPTGATRSPLATAALREQLHEPSGNRGAFSHVLLVKAEAGSTTEETQHSFFKGDSFTVVSTLSVDYALISASDSNILAAGSTGARVVGHGKFGSSLLFTVGD